MKTFKTAHHAIVDGVSQVQLFLRSYKEARAKLNVVEELLLNHFGRQDEKFFNDLMGFYQSDRQRLKMLEFLSVDLKDIKIQYLTFCDRYWGEWSDIKMRNFPKDFTDFTALILQRVRIEEEYLFPLLENCKAKQRIRYDDN